MGVSLWNQYAIPVLFSVFWLVLFVVQLCSDTLSANTTADQQGVLFFLLSRCDPALVAMGFPDDVHVRLFIISLFLLHHSVSECCATPYSLLGLTFVVSYLALGLLNLCKFYLGGYAAVQNENVMHRWGVFVGTCACLTSIAK